MITTIEHGISLLPSDWRAHFPYGDMQTRHLLSFKEVSENETKMEETMKSWNSGSEEMNIDVCNSYVNVSKRRKNH